MSDIDISAEILTALQEYSTELALAVNTQAKKAASKLAKELRNTSPRRVHTINKDGEDVDGKHYADGWKQRQTENSGTVSEYTVYNAFKPSITHLLEFGHAINGGTQRVKAYPHIAQAKEKAVNSFVEQVEKAIEEAGR